MIRVQDEYGNNVDLVVDLTGYVTKAREDTIDECKYKIVDILEKQLGCKVCSSYEEKYHCSKCAMQKTINSVVDVLEQSKKSLHMKMVVKNGLDVLA